MGYELEAVAVEVLESGLPAVPEDLPPDGSIVPVARATWGNFGAVLFVRRWRNGRWDCDSAVTTLAADGRWKEPNGSGGGPWIDTGLRRPDKGWDGDPIVWMGSCGVDLDGRDGRRHFVLAHRAIASRAVAGVRIEQDGASRVESVSSPIGALLVLAYGDRSVQISALDTNEQVLSYRDGEPAVFRAG